MTLSPKCMKIIGYYFPSGGPGVGASMGRLMLTDSGILDVPLPGTSIHMQRNMQNPIHQWALIHLTNGHMAKYKCRMQVAQLLTGCGSFGRAHDEGGLSL